MSETFVTFSAVCRCRQSSFCGDLCCTSNRSTDATDEPDQLATVKLYWGRQRVECSGYGRTIGDDGVYGEKLMPGGGQAAGQIEGGGRSVDNGRSVVKQVSGRLSRRFDEMWPTSTIKPNFRWPLPVGRWRPRAATTTSKVLGATHWRARTIDD